MSASIQNKILKFAENNSKVRAVILNGSRANANIHKDALQDFDIVFIVEDLNSFIENREWIFSFGEPILQQIPDEMSLGNDLHEIKYSFTFLTYFKDGNRIDLTLFPIEKFERHFQTDSLSIVWIDKDKRLTNIPEASDKDYHIRKPTQQEFSEVCNEFWWCITNVAKGLKRKEIIYAKDMMENVVRPMFLQILEWKIGFENNFTVSTGKSGKLMNTYLDSDFYNTLLKTYSDSIIDNNWNSLFLMMTIFKKEQENLSEKLHLKTNSEEIVNAFEIVNKIKVQT